MAEVALSSLLKVVFQNLASPVMEEFGLLWGVGDELEKLLSTLSTIHAVLKDADRKQVQAKAVQDWLAKLEEVAYDADDILDEFTTEANIQKALSRRQTGEVRRFLSFPNPTKVLFRHDIAHRIKEIRKRLDDINKDRMDLHLREGDGGRAIEVREQLPTSSFVDESDIVGRQLDKVKLLLVLLFDQMSNSGLCVYPIVGIGGLGKTTLAQLVYNSMVVKVHFELRIWICVSENFDVKRLTKAIIESITLKPCELEQLDALQNVLIDILRCKKYLLVLDDVWADTDDAQGHWVALRVPLASGARGSKVIVTTRSMIVASYMGTRAPYYLEGLSEEDCLSLFNHWAFLKRDPNAHPDLVKIGEKIVDKCHGLPLAAKTLGCLLSSKFDEGEWNVVLKSDTWDLHSPEDRSGILPALNLSYQHLPSHLKRCFAYCSLFPKDYVYNRDKLVRLWMAEGFIHPEGSGPMEYVAQSYFDDLLNRSFFQYAYSHQQKKFVYTMHDLIHDLAESISGDGCFRVQDDKPDSIIKKTRHLSVCDEVEQIEFEAAYKSNILRTLLLMREMGRWEEGVPRKMFQKLKCLRVLDLHRLYGVKKLPNSIGEMRHLRYLDLSYTQLKSMPASICNLYNLQTLILISCFYFKKLPKSIGNLINLRYLDLSRTSLERLPASICNLYDLRTLILSETRISELPNATRNLINLQHLNVEKCSDLISTPPGIGGLTSLQTLPAYVVGKDIGCGVGELKAMNNLRGELCISKLENVINLEESNLKDKRYIYKLCLKWSYEYDNSRDGEAEKELLRSLQPHTNLNTLTIEYYSGTEFPSWMGDRSFSYLINVSLNQCRNCKILPTLGQLPLLKYLHIEGIHGVGCIGREFQGQGMIKGFPSLEKLLLIDMPNLKEWSGIEENELPKLHTLSISLCRKLKILPYLPPNVRTIDLFGCPDLTSLPYACLQNLQNLILSGCNDWIFNSLSHLTSIEYLEITFPRDLISLPRELLQPLSKLQVLKLIRCDALFAQAEWEGLKYLVSLQYLAIENSHRNTHLPEQGLPTTILGLQVKNFSELEALPKELKNLTSLVQLRILDCRKLKSLPEEELPATLEYLHIRGCPLLEERCQKERGEDWCRIAHIPTIVINDQQISQS